jgi:hypothetical protein
MNAIPDHYQTLLHKVLSQTEATDLEAWLNEQLKAKLEAEAGMNLLQQKLILALFEIEKLRRKLFGRSADKRTSQGEPIEELSPVEVGPSKK